MLSNNPILHQLNLIFKRNLSSAFMSKKVFPLEEHLLHPVLNKPQCAVKHGNKASQSSMINLQKEGALVSLTVSSLLDAGLWGELQKAGPAPRARAAEDGSFPDAQLWSLSGLGFLAAFVLGHHNSTFLFPTDFEDGLDHRKCSTDHRPTCAYSRHVQPTQPDREQPPIPQQCKLQQSASKPALKSDWTAKTKTKGAVHWCNKPVCPFNITCHWRQGGHCNKPSEGLCANTLEGISLSQKEQMSFVTNGNGFSAHT